MQNYVALAVGGSGFLGGTGLGANILTVYLRLLR